MNIFNNFLRCRSIRFHFVSCSSIPVHFFFRFHEALVERSRIDDPQHYSLQIFLASAWGSFDRSSRWCGAHLRLFCPFCQRLLVVAIFFRFLLATFSIDPAPPSVHSLHALRFLHSPLLPAFLPAAHADPLQLFLTASFPAVRAICGFFLHHCIRTRRSLSFSWTVVHLRNRDGPEAC